MLLRQSFRLAWLKSVPSNWFINIGPHISHWLSGKGEVSAGGSYRYNIVFGPQPQSPSSPDFDKMYMQDVNRWLFGIGAGIGFNAFIRKSQYVHAELRFISGHTYFGTKTSATNRTLGFMDNMQANEKVISFTLSYTFDIDVQESRKGKSTIDKSIRRKKRN